MAKPIQKKKKEGLNAPGEWTLSLERGSRPADYENSHVTTNADVVEGKLELRDENHNAVLLIPGTYTKDDLEDLADKFGGTFAWNGYGPVVAMSKSQFIPLIKEIYPKGITIMSESKSKKKIREEENLIDQAAPAAGAPMPQPVPAPMEAAPPMGGTPGPMNPMMPPAPGMIPTGWMYPNQSAQAVAMDTGDVNLAGAAPGAGVVEGQPVSNEEAQLVTEYRKWAKNKKLEATKQTLGKRMKKKVKEDFAGAGAPGFGEETPEEEEAFGDEAEIDISDEMGEETDGLADIAVDINKLFIDAGVAEEDLLPEDEPEEEGMTDEELEDHEASETPEEEAAEEAMEESRKVRIAKLKERIDEESRKARIAKLKERIAKVRSNKKAIKENKLVDQLSDGDYEAGPDALFADEDYADNDFDGNIADDMFEEDDVMDDMDPGNAVQDYGVEDELFEEAASKASDPEAMQKVRAVLSTLGLKKDPKISISGKGYSVKLGTWYSDAEGKAVYNTQADVDALQDKLDAAGYPEVKAKLLGFKHSPQWLGFIVPYSSYRAPEGEAEDELFERKERIKRVLAKRKKEALGAKDVDIRFPAGTTAPKISPEAAADLYEPAGSATTQYEKRAKARREALRKAREHVAMLEGMEDPDLSDADKEVGCVVDDVVEGGESVAAKLGGKSRVVAESTNRATQFVERYKEKQSLDFKKLLSDGLLG